MTTIIIAAILAFIAGTLLGLALTTKVYTTHYHQYKKSKDYERLWTLLQDRFKVFVICKLKHGTPYCDIAYIHDYEYSDEPTLFGLGSDAREFWKPENKSKFIGYCMLNDYEFLDPVDEVKND